MELIRLSGRHNYQEVVDEWQYEFVYYVLSNMGLPEEALNECFVESIPSVEDKIKLRDLLAHFDLQIIDDCDGGLEIYLDEELMAKWDKCKYVLKEDRKELDRSKRLYVEIHANVWTIFDGE